MLLNILSFGPQFIIQIETIKCLRCFGLHLISWQSVSNKAVRAAERAQCWGQLASISDEDAVSNLVYPAAAFCLLWDNTGPKVWFGKLSRHFVCKFQFPQIPIMDVVCAKATRLTKSTLGKYARVKYTRILVIKRQKFSLNYHLFIF